MSVWDKYECEGQMSLFDYFGPKKEELKCPPFDESLLVGIKGISEIVPLLPKYKITLKRPDFEGGKKEKTAVWVGYWHSISDSGWNYDMKHIESYSELKPDECKFSFHTCNKEELWKVAESLDDIKCTKQCCRLCKVLECGARCNGSEEPSKCYSCFHEDQGKCWCRQSEHFEKYVPSKHCTYLDLC